VKGEAPPRTYGNGSIVAQRTPTPGHRPNRGHEQKGPHEQMRNNPQEPVGPTGPMGPPFRDSGRGVINCLERAHWTTVPALPGCEGPNYTIKERMESTGGIPEIRALRGRASLSDVRLVAE
jgi:hypothetical protein